MKDEDNCTPPRPSPAERVGEHRKELIIIMREGGGIRLTRNARVPT